MIVNNGGTKYVDDPEVHGDGTRLFAITDARVKKYFDKGNRIAVTFKMNAPPKPEQKDDKKKGASTKK